MSILDVEVIECRDDPGCFSVEAIDNINEGDCYITLFGGPQSLERAVEYAMLMYNWAGQPIHNLNEPKKPKNQLNFKALCTFINKYTKNETLNDIIYVATVSLLSFITTFCIISLVLILFGGAN